MSLQKIDLNSDIGESFGAYKLGMDEDVLEGVTSANIACGFHAGDYNVMNETVRMTKVKGVGIGAHPGLPDLMGFGRRPMQVDAEEVYHFVLYQVGALQAFCTSHGVRMQHVKAHGALYNMAGGDSRLADAIARAVRDFDRELVLFGLSGSELISSGDKYGLQTASEVFADRTYQPDGSLTPRSDKNAMITDTNKAVEQVLRMIFEGKVTAVDGSDVEIQADTVCVHGDSPQALEFVYQLQSRLSDEGICVAGV